MDCCADCAKATSLGLPGPCASKQVAAPPLRGVARRLGVGSIVVAGMPVAPVAGGAGGALGGWWLGGVLLGSRNTLGKALAAAAGAWAGWTAGQASGL